MNPSLLSLSTRKSSVKGKTSTRTTVEETMASPTEQRSISDSTADSTSVVTADSVNLLKADSRSPSGVKFQPSTKDSSMPATTSMSGKRCGSAYDLESMGKSMSVPQPEDDVALLNWSDFQMKPEHMIIKVIVTDSWEDTDWKKDPSVKIELSIRKKQTAGNDVKLAKRTLGEFTGAGLISDGNEKLPCGDKERFEVCNAAFEALRKELLSRMKELDEHLNEETIRRLFDKRLTVKAVVRYAASPIRHYLGVCNEGYKGTRDEFSKRREEKKWLSAQQASSS